MKAQKEHTGFVRFFIFTMTRNIGTAADCAVLWVLVEYVFDGYFLENIVSPTISFEIATFINFLTSFYWVFYNRMSTQTQESFFRRFLKFNLSAVMGFGIKMILLLLCKTIFGWHIVICNVIALTLSGLFNYFIADLWVFKKNKKANTPEIKPTEE